MFTINHLLLILFLVTVNPQTISSSYELIINKKCNQDGRSIITDIFDCQTAAEKLGFKDDQNKPPEAFERSFSDEPPGCYWSPDQKILSYNTKTSSTRTCSSKKKCICLGKLKKNNKIVGLFFLSFVTNSSCLLAKKTSLFLHNKTSSLSSVFFLSYSLVVLLLFHLPLLISSPLFAILL